MVCCRGAVDVFIAVLVIAEDSIAIRYTAVEIDFLYYFFVAMDKNGETSDVGDGDDGDEGPFSKSGLMEFHRPFLGMISSTCSKAWTLSARTLLRNVLPILHVASIRNRLERDCPL